MGKVYRPPEEFKVPEYSDYRDNFKAYHKACDEYAERLQQWARDNGKGSLAGEMVRFQVADGYAQYIVFSLRPVKLIHVDVSDAYQFQYAHRLTAQDIKEQIRREKALDELFSRPREVTP